MRWWRIAEGSKYHVEPIVGVGVGLSRLLMHKEPSERKSGKPLVNHDPLHNFATLGFQTLKVMISTRTCLDCGGFLLLPDPLHVQKH